MNGSLGLPSERTGDRPAKSAPLRVFLIVEIGIGIYLLLSLALLIYGFIA